MNYEVGVVYVAAPPLGVTMHPQPAVASFVYQVGPSGVRTLFSPDGYTLIQASQNDVSAIQMRAPVGPLAHHHPISIALWRNYIELALKQDLHLIWRVHGMIFSKDFIERTVANVTDGTTIQRGVHCGRVHLKYSVPMTSTERTRVLALLEAERAKTINDWRDILDGSDSSSLLFQRTREDVLAFRTPLGGDQCEVEKSNRAHEAAKRDPANSEDDALHAIHCSIERDEDCDCAERMRAVFPTD